jgi:hypothetical protein
MTLQDFQHQLAHAQTTKDRIEILITAMEDIMSAVDAVRTALTQLITDTTTALTDITAKIQALEGQVADPATIQALVDDLNTLDATVKAADPGPAA